MDIYKMREMKNAIRRIESTSKVTGTAQYLDDLEMQGMAYQNRDALGEFAKGVYDEYRNWCGFNLPEAQQELANRMGIEKKADVVAILMRFYYCTKREPRFVSTYTENDGSTHSGTGSLFDR